MAPVIKIALGGAMMLRNKNTSTLHTYTTYIHTLHIYTTYIHSRYTVFEKNFHEKINIFIRKASTLYKYKFQWMVHSRRLDDFHLEIDFRRLFWEEV